MDAPPVDRLFCQEHRRVADVRTGEALKASKRETHPKMRPPPALPVRPRVDHPLERRHVDAGQPVQRSRAHGRALVG